MLGWMILTLFATWVLILTWRAIKWPQQQEVPAEGPPRRRRFVLVCHRCQALEETDSTFGLDPNSKSWDKFLCSKCKKGEGRDGGSEADSKRRTHGT